MNAREQRLLAIFVGAIIAGGTWMGYKKLSAGIEEIKEEAKTLAREAEQDQALVETSGKSVKAAEDWLKDRMGKPLTKADAKSKLLLAVQSSAEEAGLEVAPPKLDLADENRGLYRMARLSAEVTGAEKTIYPWLAQFHNPDALRAVISIEVRPDKKDNTQIQCTVEFGQWYQPDDSEVES